MIGNLLDKLFVAVSADLTEFKEAMRDVTADARGAGKEVGGAFDKASKVAAFAFDKIKTAASVGLAATGKVLEDGFVYGVERGVAKAIDVAADEGIWAGLWAGGKEAAISAGQEIADGFVSDVLPQVLEATGAMDALKGAAAKAASSLTAFVPVLGAVGKAFMTLMLSPLGLVVAAVAAIVAAWYYWDEIEVIVKRVGAAISAWYTENVKPTVDKAMAILKPFIDFFKDYFGAQIETVINVVSSLLEGDFVGAWEAAKAGASKMIDALFGVLKSLVPNVISTLANLHRGVHQWIVGKLGEVFNWLKGKLEAVGGYFFDLYDAVVGNSYIPDMVDGVRDHIARLEGVMVRPIQAATEASGKAFADLTDRVNNILDGLFPEQAQARKLEKELADLDAAYAAKLIQPRVWREARNRLNKEIEELAASVERANPYNVQTVDIEAIEFPPMPDISADLQRVADDVADQFEEPILDSVERVAVGVANMAESFDQSLRGLSQSIKDGDILGIIGGVLDTILNVVGAIGAIKGGFSGSGSVPGRATGGSVAAGGTFMVGENGPEILRMGSQGGRVYNTTDTKKMLAANDGGGGAVNVKVAVDANPYFDARVVEVTRPGMNAAAQSGAQGGHALVVREQREQSRRRKPE